MDARGRLPSVRGIPHPHGLQRPPPAAYQVGNWPGSRLDRVLARLRDFKVVAMSRLGTEPIPGVTYSKTFRNGGSKTLPVLPSDHFGLLLQLEATGW